MDVQELLSRATDTVTVKKVYGDPIERDGALVIPVARVRGGAGGGAGTDKDQEASGSGGGLPSCGACGRTAIRPDASGR